MDEQRSQLYLIYKTNLQSLYDSGLAELLEARRKAVRVLVDALEKPRDKLKAAELILNYSNSSRPAVKTYVGDISHDISERSNKRERLARFDSP